MAVADTTMLRLAVRGPSHPPGHCNRQHVQRCCHWCVVGGAWSQSSPGAAARLAKASHPADAQRVAGRWKCYDGIGHRPSLIHFSPPHHSPQCSPWCHLSHVAVQHNCNYCSLLGWVFPIFPIFFYNEGLGLWLWLWLHTNLTWPTLPGHRVGIVLRRWHCAFLHSP